MAYNSPFPVNYQPAQIYYPQYPQMQMQIPTNTPSQAQQTSSSTNGIIWVQGEAGAKSYLVAPNSTVQLWDSERQTIYLKSADASGMPSMKTLDYTIRDLTPANAPVAAPAQDPNYATKADLQALYGRVEALQSELESLTAKRAPAKPKKEVEVNE